MLRKKFDVDSTEMDCFWKAVKTEAKLPILKINSNFFQNIISY